MYANSSVAAVAVAKAIREMIESKPIGCTVKPEATVALERVLQDFAEAIWREARDFYMENPHA